MRYAPQVGRTLGQREDPVRLDNNRRGQQQDQRRVCSDHMALKAEQQHNSQQQPQNRSRFDPGGKLCHRHRPPAPDQGQPRQRPQQDQPGDILARVGGADQSGKDVLKNNTPSTAMLKGFISQLTTTVMPSPLGRFPMPFRLAKSTATIIG